MQSKTSDLITGAMRTAVNNPALTLGGVAAARGLEPANVHKHNIMDQIARNKQDLSTPIKIAEYVQAGVQERNQSFERFAASKHLTKSAAPSSMPSLPGMAMSALAGSVLEPFTKALITNPLNKAISLIDKKFYLDPKQKNVFMEAISTDPLLAKAYQTSPEMIDSSYKLLKTYAPSLTINPTAVKNFLRQAVITGGQIDHATIKILAETEKMVRQSRGELKGVQ